MHRAKEKAIRKHDPKSNGKPTKRRQQGNESSGNMQPRNKAPKISPRETREGEEEEKKEAKNKQETEEKRQKRKEGQRREEGEKEETAEMGRTMRKNNDGEE